MLVFLVFMGGAGALSDAAISDNAWENYPESQAQMAIFQIIPPANLCIIRSVQSSFPIIPALRIWLYRLRRKAICGIEAVVEKVEKSR
jgi:hypothetical protein